MPRKRSAARSPLFNSGWLDKVALVELRSIRAALYGYHAPNSELYAIQTAYYRLAVAEERMLHGSLIHPGDRRTIASLTKRVDQQHEKAELSSKAFVEKYLPQ